MRIVLVRLSIVLCVYFLFPPPLSAAGMFITNERMQAAPVEARAIISFDGKRETLIVSPTFMLNPLVVWNFAWVVAVPSKPEVELLSQDPFTALESYTQKTFSKGLLFSALLYPDILEEKFTPSSLYSRPINFIQHRVFSPEEGVDTLSVWLEEFGYYLPKSSFPALSAYQDEGWYFVVGEVNALHLQTEASESLTLKGASLLPLKISFETDRIVYPGKLMAVQPDLDTVSIPFGYTYGSKAEKILGVQDAGVDSMLSVPSKNLFPRLPLDYAPVKLDVFVFSPYKTAVSLFTTIFADHVAGSQFYSLDLPDKRLFLTRMVSYRPMAQMEDVFVERASDVRRINPRVSNVEKSIRIIIVVLAFAIVGWVGRNLLYKGKLL